MGAPRKLQARATDTIIVAPIAITDRTCAAMLGLDDRVFRAVVAKLQIPHVMHGRRLIVLVADFTAAIARAAASGVATIEAPLTEAEPATVDQLLARLGRSRARAA